MTQPPHKLAIVIPTIGRHAELRRMLASLAAQTRLPDEILIMDQDRSSVALVEEFPQLKIQVVAVPGSAASKRNAGFRAMSPDIELVGVMDDDIELEPQAIDAMLKFWKQAPDDLGGAGCNLVNHPPTLAPRLKGLRLTSRLSLYDSTKGAVLRSGIHTMIGCVNDHCYVRWLSSMAAVFPRRVLDEFMFDEWFQTYSYLEDLDFTYRIGKRYRLAVVADARFFHYPSETGRPGPYLFGKKEVLNRLYFVSKHAELSQTLCGLALSIRTLMSVFLGLTRFESDYFKRAAGNLAAALLALKEKWEAARPWEERGATNGTGSGR
ncbi:MAG: glycosyltransferase [Terriglobia bacterium]